MRLERATAYIYNASMVRFEIACSKFGIHNTKYCIYYAYSFGSRQERVDADFYKARIKRFESVGSKFFETH